jgi:D-alanyl-D-alanine carboxypeptidase (penicillin-binding protein 5/6)
MLKPLGQSPSLYLGLSVSAENLLKAALLQSSNDAAKALSFSLGKQKFVQLMNKKAKELGMTNTTFDDAHGLSHKNVSTASDLIKLLAYIYKNHPEILRITKENNFWLPDKTGKLLKFQNVNNFYPLSNFIGGKTGYSKKSQTNLGSGF